MNRSKIIVYALQGCDQCLHAFERISSYGCDVAYITLGISKIDAIEQADVMAFSSMYQNGSFPVIKVGDIMVKPGEAMDLIREGE